MIALLTLFWVCFFIGIGYLLLTFLIGELLGGLLPFDLPFLQPIAIFGAILIFGLTGILALQVYAWTPTRTLLVSSVTAVIALFVVYYIFIKASSNMENSLGFTYQELIGMQAEVITAIPPDGVGEILIPTSGGRTAQIAKSSDGTYIPQGSIVIIDSVHDQICHVSLISSKER